MLRRVCGPIPPSFVNPRRAQAWITSAAWYRAHSTSKQDTQAMVQRLMQSNGWSEMERKVKKFPSSRFRERVEDNIEDLKFSYPSPAELPAAAAAKLETFVKAMYKDEPSADDIESIVRFADRLAPLGPAPEPRLSHQVGFMNPGPLRADLLEVAKLLAELGPRVDQSHIPLPTVVGPAGQGKTEVLLRLANNEKLGGVTAHKLLVRAMKPRYDIKKVVPLFATFSQESPFTKDEKDGERALVSRLAAYWRGKQWQLDWAADFPHLALCTLLEHVRKAEAAKKGCSPNEVLLLLLVDEVRKLDVVRSARCGMLDRITTEQSSCNVSQMPFLPVVSCVDLNSMFAHVSNWSNRPIGRIQVVLPRPVDADSLLKRVKEHKMFPHDAAAKRKKVLQPTALSLHRAGMAPFRRARRRAGYAVPRHLRSIRAVRRTDGDSGR
jgi:hypothetical protein